ncbi:MAG: hypothetical protein CVU05_08345 [Bacteroidetes bacterium HGW-Bacteroidetes-21]|jgi:type IX secretion system PorP/SprF family membrane protein|nr:MAG: hypothetical protein CVU05_08345 [Bacteroidetes bacterium HGW-Bacteroidetes-21]
MKKLIQISVVVVMVIISSNLNAQDHHFSQYDATLHYMNPALTGMSWEDPFTWRANAAYRSQWQGIASRPFTNQFIGFDMLWKKGIGLGGYIVNNRAGSGFLNTLNVMVGGAYKISIDPTNTHNLYGGLQLGMFHRSISITDLIFDSQFEMGSSGWEVTPNSGENMGDKSLIRIDANMGFYYRYNDKQKNYKPWGGFSLFRVTMPNESFTAEVIRMPIRWSFVGGCDVKLNEVFICKPSFLTMFQGKASEYVITVMNDYLIENTPWAITGGLSLRVKDAVIVALGAKYGRSQYRISYDFNTSYLRNYSHYKGGFELTAIYVFDKEKAVSQRSFQ